MLPPEIQELLAALKARGFVQTHPRIATELPRDDASPVILERARDGLADAVWIVHLDPEGWLVGSAFGGVVWPARDLLRGLDGERPAHPGQFGPLAEQVQAALRLADRLSTDRNARKQAHALFAPTPDDPALKGRGDDPCWCGSGKKLKRCHGTVPSPA